MSVVLRNLDGPLDAPATPPDAPLPTIGMLDAERERPWFYASLYGLALLLGIVGHHLAAILGWTA